MSEQRNALTLDEPRVKKDRDYFYARKAAHEPIVMLTCYDYPTAVLQDEAGVDIVFVGDSVGTNILGYASETEVTMDDMVHHLKAVRRGLKQAYLLVDLPHRSYESPDLALKNAERFLRSGADGVKLEGGEEQVDVIRALVENGIDVCGHIGFTPQTLGSKGKVQGKSFEQGRALLQSALALEQAGLMMIVLELVTEHLTQRITEQLRIPTIGIGSGPYCDGQVLVVTDILGISPFTRKISKRYQEYRESMLETFRRYKYEVETRQFPTDANAFPTNEEDLARLEEWLKNPI